MEFHLFVVVMSCAMGSVLCKTMLTYVCNPETNEYSVLNPNTTVYKYIRVEGKDDQVCESSFSDDQNRTFTISSCEGQLLAVILSDKPILTDNIITGHTYSVTCDKAHYYFLTEIVAEVSVEYSSDFEETKGGSDVTIALKDLQGVTGYTYMTIGYPLTVELTGPAESEMLPKQCVAYSREVSEDSTNKVMIENGCAADNELMHDFAEDLESWFDRGVVLFSEGDVCDKEPASQPVLGTHMYAFRFYSSKKTVLHCDVQLCPSESPDCDFSCE